MPGRHAPLRFIPPCLFAGRARRRISAREPAPQGRRPARPSGRFEAARPRAPCKFFRQPGETITLTKRPLTNPPMLLSFSPYCSWYVVADRLCLTNKHSPAARRPEGRFAPRRPEAALTPFPCPFLLILVVLRGRLCRPSPLVWGLVVKKTSPLFLFFLSSHVSFCSPLGVL